MVPSFRSKDVCRGISVCGFLFLISMRSRRVNRIAQNREALELLLLGIK
nr:hypothetical protein Q903MT_gene4890 [Picea sitchensis]